MEAQVVREAERPVVGYLATFKFYDSKQRRLSIFGRVVEDKLEITVLTLSETPEEVRKDRIFFTQVGNGRKKVKKVVQEVLLKYDVFSRKEGRKKYEENCLTGGKCLGVVVSTDIIENRPRYTFLKWCNDRYYRPQKEKVEVVKFVRGNKFVHPEKKKETVLIPLGEHENKSEETA